MHSVESFPILEVLCCSHFKSTDEPQIENYKQA